VPVMGSCCPIFRAGDWNLAPCLGRNRRVQAAFFEGSSLLTLAPAGGRPLPKLRLTFRGLRGSRSFNYQHVVLVRGRAQPQARACRLGESGSLVLTPSPSRNAPDFGLILALLSDPAAGAP
jgi:hypothetical protein